MLFACLYFLILIGQFLAGIILAVQRKSRTVGLVLLGFALFQVAGLFVLDLLSPKPICKEPPAKSELIGTWECTRISSEFQSKVRSSGEPLQLEIHENGRFRGQQIPIRDPDRFENVNSSWELTNGTPSGCYGVDVNGIRFMCYRHRGKVMLRRNISASRYYEADYRRIEQKKD